MKTLIADENPEREPEDIYAKYRAEHTRLTTAVSSSLRAAASLSGRAFR